jgi:hypothetical protein
MGWCGILSYVIRVLFLAFFLIGAGLGLAYLTWWFWTTARPESPALAALELMSEREYMQLPDEEKDAFLAPWRQLQHVQARKHLTKVESRPKPSRRIDVEEPQVDREPVGHDNQPHAVIDPLLRG